MVLSNKNVYLCLSGGGALGFAHIGALQALEENQIYPTHVAGASMGAIIAAFYANGYKPEEILKMIKDYKMYKLSHIFSFTPMLHKRGLASHDMLRKLIRLKISHNSFEGLQKKLSVCVSNLNNSKWEIKNNGNDLDKWVAASASIPGVFETINLENTIYTDGGVLNNMPAQPFKKYYKRTIGVDVIAYKYLDDKEMTGIVNSAITSIRAMQHQASHEGRNLCRFLIEPKAIRKYHEFNFENYLEIFKTGYDAANEYIKENKDILKLSR
jgi:NTE family protein